MSVFRDYEVTHVAKALFDMIHKGDCLEELDDVVQSLSKKLSEVFSDVEYKNGRKLLGPVEYFNNGLCKFGDRSIVLEPYDIPKDTDKAANITEEGDLNVSKYFTKINPFLNYVIRQHLGYKSIVRTKYKLASHISKIESLIKNNNEELFELSTTRLGEDLGISMNMVISEAKEDIASFLSCVTDVEREQNYSYYSNNNHDKWFYNEHNSTRTITVPYFDENISKIFQDRVRRLSPVEKDMNERVMRVADKMSKSQDCHRYLTFRKRMIDYHTAREDTPCGLYKSMVSSHKVIQTLEALKDVRDTFYQAFKDDPVAIDVLQKMGIIPSNLEHM